MRFAKLCLLMVALSGCGGGSQVSPIVEYNAAVQAFDRELDLLEKSEISLKGSDPKSPKTKEFQAQVDSQRQLVERLRTAKNNAKARLP